MTTPQPLLIAQSYVITASSTSTATIESTAPVVQPRSLAQIGTSALTHGALILVLWAYDAAPFQRNVVREITQHGSKVQAVPAAPIARSSEMVTTIIKVFGLNRSQAADVMQVRRQSVYNWLGGTEAEGENLARLLCLYDMANSMAKTVEPHLAVRFTPDGTSSLLRMLSADQLDRTAILSWTAALMQPSEAHWPPSLDDVLRDAGALLKAEHERQRGADGIRYLQG